MHDTTSHSATARMAARSPFGLGALSIDPLARTLAGATAERTIEPRVMQVLLALIDADGAVVTRPTLLHRCWGGVYVGEDSLNRAIFELRRMLRAVGAEIAVETISGTGYRLTGLPASASDLVPAEQPSARAPDASASTDVPRHTRRWMIGGLAAAAGLATGAGVLWSSRLSSRERTAAALVERGDIARRDDVPDAAEQGIGFYREAIELTPDNAAIWGKLALAFAATAEYAEPARTAAAVTATEQSAARALQLQPRQADAAVALITLAPDFGDWLSVERRLREVLAATPDNVTAKSALAMLLIEVGRVRESAEIVDWLVDREPLSPPFNYRQVYLLWARGKLHDADRVADRALQLWPRHPSVWLARLWTFALTGRPAAARAMLDDRDAGPPLAPPMRQLLRLSCTALLTGTRADIVDAVSANEKAAREGQFGVVNAALTLPKLGEVDAAFEILRGYLIREGPLVGELRRPAEQPAINQENRRKTMMLWMPSAASLRSDARFEQLCREVGLDRYWRGSTSRPDYLTT